MYTLFICGTPHNKKGFEFSAIDGYKSIPDECIQFIDKYDADKMIDGSTYVIQNIGCNKKRYLLIENYVSINPSDQKTSRGAYIAVGIVTDNTLSLSSAINYLCKIISVQSSLVKLRDSRNAFHTNFDMRKDIDKLNLSYQDIGFLANLALHHYDNESSKRIVFNDTIHSGTSEINNGAITNQIIMQEELIFQLKEKFQEESEAHQLTIAESQNYTQEIERLNQENIRLHDKIQHLEKQFLTLRQQSKIGEPPRARSLDNTRHHDIPNGNMRHTEPILTKKGRKSRTSNSGFLLQGSNKKPKRRIIYTVIFVTILSIVAYLIYSKYYNNSIQKTPSLVADNNYSESTNEAIENFSVSSTKNTLKTSDSSTEIDKNASKLPPPIL